jgi:hypothetical protein
VCSGASLPPELLQRIIEREANAEPIKIDHVATAIAKDALENLGGVEVLSIGPLFARRRACVGGRGHAGCLSHIALKQSSLTFKVSPAARLFVCAIKRRIDNTRVCFVLPHHFLLVFERFLTDGFPYVLFAFVKLREIPFRPKLV